MGGGGLFFIQCRGSFWWGRKVGGDSPDIRRELSRADGSLVEVASPEIFPRKPAMDGGLRVEYDWGDGKVALVFLSVAGW